MEFTGNIVGYSSSVVRSQITLLLADNVLNPTSTVDRLCLLIYRERHVMADTPLHPMHYRLHPRRGFHPHS